MFLIIFRDIYSRWLVTEESTEARPESQAGSLEESTNGRGETEAATEAGQQTSRPSKKARTRAVDEEREEATSRLQAYLSNGFHQAQAVRQALCAIIQKVRWRVHPKVSNTYTWTILPSGGAGPFFEDLLLASLVLYRRYDQLWSNKVKLLDSGHMQHLTAEVKRCMQTALARINSS
jgi:hypothetical protein